MASTKPRSRPPQRINAKVASSIIRRSAREFLKNEHVIYKTNRDEWTLNERRLFGGRAVLQDLATWKYEATLDGSVSPQFGARLAQAIYLNFPYLYASTIVGHLMASAPQPGTQLNFGQLGEVRRELRNRLSPTRAEQLYYNADGIGDDGSEWNQWWAETTINAIGTGHRWVYVESPEAPFIETVENGETLQRRKRRGELTLRDELDGVRPYLNEYSPIEVPDWHSERGVLRYAIIRVPLRAPRVDNTGALAGVADDDGYLLLVRNGFDGFDAAGEKYSDGGWWLYDADLAPVSNGRFESTKGAIPLIAYYHQRSRGIPGWPAMSRSGIFELGQAAVAYMNAESAAQFDAIDAAASVTYLLGTDKEGHNLAVEMHDSGSKIIPVPPVQGVTTTVPSVYDSSAGAVAADVFQTLLERITSLARWVAALDATSAPDSTGLSKEAGFAERMGPGLARQAANIQAGQGTAIWFTEQRWGFPEPTGSVIWPKKFDLLDLQTKLERLFNLEKLSGISSPTLAARAMTQAARELNLLGDSTKDAAIEAEYEQSAERRTATAEAASSLFADIGAGGNGNGAPPVGRRSGALARRQRGKPGDATGGPTGGGGAASGG